MRHHANILTSIWADEDFRKLSVNAQHLYLALLSQPKLNVAGVQSYLPAKWANLSCDGKVETIEEAAAELEAANFVVIDRATAEVCIRTYTKHDTPRGWPTIRGMWACWAEIESPRISCAVLRALPDEVLTNPMAPPPLTAYNLLNGYADTPSDTVSDTRLDTRIETILNKPPPSDTPSDTPSPKAPKSKASAKAKPEDFAFWYAIYPRKIERPQAIKAFNVAMVKDSLGAIVAGTEVWVRHWQLTGTEKKYIPYPATFLNGERWRDEPDPIETPKRPTRNPVLRTLLDSLGDDDDQQRDQGLDGPHVDPLAELAWPGGSGNTRPHRF